uniref:Uncharacterized protein n=1 Tax=Meloidogyne hapla TaxID=6305 RepID=A0A1I8BAF8_MELHA
MDTSCILNNLKPAVQRHGLYTYYLEMPNGSRMRQMADVVYDDRQDISPKGSRNGSTSPTRLLPLLPLAFQTREERPSRTRSPSIPMIRINESERKRNISLCQ